MKTSLLLALGLTVQSFACFAQVSRAQAAARELTVAANSDSTSAGTGATSNVVNPLYAPWKGQESKRVAFDRTETISGGAPVPGGNTRPAATSKVTYTLSEITAEQAVVKVVHDSNSPAELLTIPAKLASDDSELPKPAGKEDLKLGEKTYACTKYTYSTKSKAELGRDGQGLPGSVTVWVADGVPGGVVKRTVSLTIRASYFISETLAP